MSATAAHDTHQNKGQETSEGHPLGLETENILQDMVRGWSYIRKGGWIFLVLLVIIGFFVARSWVRAFEITLTDIFVEWLKVLLS